MPLTTPRLRFVWRSVSVYRAVYRSRRREVVVRSLQPQPKTRVFRVAGGESKFKRVEYTRTKKEVLIVARSRKTATKSKDIVDKDLEELEELEDLEDLEDELEDEEPEDEEEEDEEEEEEDEDLDDDLEDLDEDLEEDEDEEEEEAPKRRTRKPATARSKKRSRSNEVDGRIGTQEVADHFKVSSRDLRVLLRKQGIEKDADTQRYEWDSLEDPEVVRIGKLIRKGAIDKAKKESLDRLKEATAKKKAAKKAAKAEDNGDEPDDDLDEVDDLEDEEEVEETPKPRRRKTTATATKKAPAKKPAATRRSTRK